MTGRGDVVVIYDADCGVCAACASWLLRRDTRHALALVPIDDVVVTHGRRLARPDLEREMHVVDATGHVFRGFAAWRRIAVELPRYRRVVSVLYAPGIARLGDALYALVANHRHLISRWLGLSRPGHACAVTPRDRA